MDVSEIDERPDHEFVFVHRTVVSELARFLDPDAGWVWVLGHHPRRHGKGSWWEATVPLTSTRTFTGAVRNLFLDLQMPTAEFAALAPELDNESIALVQSDRPMPDSLQLSRIDKEQQPRVLAQNGAVLWMWLPHPLETAIVRCFRPGYLAEVIDRLS